ncbi:hypothetical protein [Arthrobacter sp. H14]|uniref:hypothetical protein n=1 Tax=Arthrobacter sp. H14 TaxID=1312959 RepID=UPI0004B528CC|nr:hypothetical protein [Arthrobacter sp. H14]
MNADAVNPAAGNPPPASRPGTGNPSLSLARAVADAVLYEGYLLYPYRASSRKNQSRWQFGMLGPPGAAASGAGEESTMFADALLTAGPQASVEVHLRFLQLQTRSAERLDDGTFTPVNELTVGAARWLTWDEASEQEITLGPFALAQLEAGESIPVDVPANEDIEVLQDDAGLPAGRLVRRRLALSGTVHLGLSMPDGASADHAAGDGPEDPAPPNGANSGRLVRLRVSAENTAPGLTADKHDAVATSFIGTHLLLSTQDADFISLLEPPAEAQAAAAGCAQHRCWPVLAGPEGQRDVLLISPIILYDHPAVAPESSVALFDSTEIDEILTLRVLTLTEEEKAEARATDPRAAEIIDRCEAMTPQELQQLHGVLRNPRAEAANVTATTEEPGFCEDPPEAVIAQQDEPFSATSGYPADAPAAGLPWWHPEADASVQPDVDAVVIKGVAVSRGSLVRVHPQRRADAQDLFFAGQTARVTSVHFDVDGSTHVGLVLDVDPASDLYDGYGRSFYFAPDELEPLKVEPPEPGPTQDQRKENQP